MSEFVFKLPDLGEGTVEAEIVEWHVEPGDEVLEEQIIVDVMTDKANVELPAPVSGRVLRTSGEPGDMVAVGAALIVIETDADAPAAQPAVQPPMREESESVPPATDQMAVQDAAVASADDVRTDEDVHVEQEPVQTPARVVTASSPSSAPAATNESPRTRPVLASPALRRRAKEAGVELSSVPGSGPKGRVTRQDLDSYLAGTQRPAANAPLPDETVTEQKVIGVRRVIAQRMVQSKTEIPHFAYVEEVDVTELESLRRHLSEANQRKLSILPFIATALVRALASFPQCNAHYDVEKGVLRRFSAVHLGIAAQTPDGLKVPVVKNAQSLDLWGLSDAIAAVAETARSGSASRDALTGSSITITSLGRMGGVVTTPVINYPEVGIIGVNKVLERPMVVDGAVVVRSMMNLSSSFDHRFVDGFDAAAMIQQIKGLLEHPASLFIPTTAD
ncbi:MAG: 2-oxo acid dehydrogenase subunit E2 [Pseudomonadaceae bacterium]|nr:2-oxo acid dehydrogenase subunit E2 [Pseudomonadaceae bacterium]